MFITLISVPRIILAITKTAFGCSLGYNFLYIHLSLPSARQRPSYGDCLKVKREYYQNSSVLDCVTQCSQGIAEFAGLENDGLENDGEEHKA